jgi:hypothetical protein
MYSFPPYHEEGGRHGFNIDGLTRQQKLREKKISFLLASEENVNSGNKRRKRNVMFLFYWENSINSPLNYY